MRITKIDTRNMLLQQQSPFPNLLRSCEEEFSETKTIIILQGVNFPATTKKHHWILYAWAMIDCLKKFSKEKKKHSGKVYTI